MPRSIIVLLAAWVLGTGCLHERPKAFVMDREHVLDPAQHRALDSLFRVHEARTGNEILLVTDSTLQGKTARDFAVDFGNAWGVGKKGRDNGVTIAYSKHRREVFVATGSGTEHVLTDSVAQGIVDGAMTPRFKEDAPYQGLWDGSVAIVRFLELPENRIP